MRDRSLCVGVCASCGGAKDEYGRLQLQPCQPGSDAQAWALTPATSPEQGVTVRTSKQFLQSEKCAVWIICASKARTHVGADFDFQGNDTLVPYTECAQAGLGYREALSFSASGLLKPSSAAHNRADVCIQAAPPPPKPPGWLTIPLPSPAQLAWSRHEITALGCFLPLCGRGNTQKPEGSGYERRNCEAPFSSNCLPAAEFNPRNVDTDGWVEAVASMGARVAVLVVRHGCGFDLFPTNATLPSGFSYAYNIQNAPFQQGQGDLVRDFVASCRKYNVTPGFYAQVRASRLIL